MKGKKIHVMAATIINQDGMSISITVAACLKLTTQQKFNQSEKYHWDVLSRLR